MNETTEQRQKDSERLGKKEKQKIKLFQNYNKSIFEDPEKNKTTAKQAKK